MKKELHPARNIATFAHQQTAMGKIPISVHPCTAYQLEPLLALFRETYAIHGGPDLHGRTVLLKPNILMDTIPSRAVTTHPVFLEAAIRFVQEAGAARVLVGDSPAMHGPDFRPVQCGLYEVCERTGAEWTYFARKTTECLVGNHKVTVTAVRREADVFISLPKLKTHGLMMFTGALKNTFGLLPALNKARQHAVHSNQTSFARFLWQLNQVFPTDFVFMDGIIGMHGPGPSNGIPIRTGVVIASPSALAADLAGARICGYATREVPLNVYGLQHDPVLHSWDDLLYTGPDPDSLIRPEFRRIKEVGIRNIMVRFLIDRLPAVRRLDRRPIFGRERCIGCGQCVAICPAQALRADPNDKKHILIQDNLCIRCFCCHEVCRQNAIEIKRKLF